MGVAVEALAGGTASEAAAREQPEPGDVVAPVLDVLTQQRQPVEFGSFPAHHDAFGFQAAFGQEPGGASGVELGLGLEVGMVLEESGALFQRDRVGANHRQVGNTSAGKRGEHQADGHFVLTIHPHFARCYGGEAG